MIFVIQYRAVVDKNATIVNEKEQNREQKQPNNKKEGQPDWLRH